MASVASGARGRMEEASIASGLWPRRRSSPSAAAGAAPGGCGGADGDGRGGAGEELRRKACLSALAKVRCATWNVAVREQFRAASLVDFVS